MKTQPQDYLTCFHELFDAVDYFVAMCLHQTHPIYVRFRRERTSKTLLNAIQDANRQKSKPKPIL